MLKKSCLLLLLAASVPSFAQKPDVRINPISIGASQEMGLIERGQYNNKVPNALPFQDDWIDHFGASIGMSAVVNERLYVSAGLGGVFEFRKPESVNIGYEGSQRKGFFIGPATEAVYHFGEDPTQPWLKLGVGNFWYKYNPEASNLGEYLFRSEGYPTYTMTGGYSIIGSAGAQLQGFKALFKKGNAKLDVFLTTETSLAPFYNWSPSAVVGYTVADGLVDVGAGISLKHFFQVKPSRSQQERDENGYFQSGGVWYFASADYYLKQSEFYTARGNAADSTKIQELDATAALVDAAVLDPATDIKYFDVRSTLLNARVTLDPKKLFESDLFGPQDLKIFSEVGILGTRNYPIFYKKVTERMPVMVGFNFPGFKFFDLISLQGEYMNSPFVNSTYSRSVHGANTPFYPSGSDRVMSKNEYNDIAGKDNVKWSMLVKKSLGNVTLSAQAASDHLRVPSSEYYYGPQFDPNEVTITKEHWYVMTQIAWGI
jgi:hypothetical protein